MFRPRSVSKMGGGGNATAEEIAIWEAEPLLPPESFADKGRAIEGYFKAGPKNYLFGSYSYRFLCMPTFWPWRKGGSTVCLLLGCIRMLHVHTIIQGAPCRCKFYVTDIKTISDDFLSQVVGTQLCPELLTHTQPRVPCDSHSLYGKNHVIGIYSYLYLTVHYKDQKG